MDNKSIIGVLIVIIVLVVAGAGIYFATSDQGNDGGDDGTTPGGDTDEPETPADIPKRWNMVIMDTDGDPAHYETYYVDVGNPIEEINPNAKDGLIFTGWVEQDTGLAWDFNTVVTDDMVLNGTWVRLFDVSVSGYNATVNIASWWSGCTIIIDWGDSTTDVLESGTMSATHEYTVSDATIEVIAHNDGNTWSSTQRVAMGGHYNPLREFTVTFDGNGGVSFPIQTVTIGDRVLNPGNPYRSGYIFDGWIDSNGRPYDISSPVVNDLRLRATWVEDPDYGDSILPTANAAVTETRNGWSIDASSSEDAMHYVWYDGDKIIGVGESIELDKDDYPGYHTITLRVYSNTNSSNTWSDIIQG